MTGGVGTVGVRIAGATAGLVLAWYAASHSLSRITQANAPEQALGWSMREAAAIRAAERSVENDPARAERYARQALDHAPLSTQALRLLGQLAARSGDMERADALMATALRRTIRNSAAQLWTFRRALERRDFPAFFKAADAILRRRPNDLALLMPTVLQVLGAVPKAQDALVERFRWSPPWRRNFLTVYIAKASPASVEGLLAAMSRAGTPATEAEFNAYLQRLVRDKQVARARDVWVQNLPPDDRAQLGLLYDGGFERMGASSPFVWTIKPGAGITAIVETAPDRSTKALHIEYSGGGSSRRVAEQLLVLPPGRYQLTGEARHQSGLEHDRLTWTMRCEGGAELGRVRHNSAPGQWSPFALSFDVSPDCAAQRLILQTFAGDTLAPISVWYDNLAIAARQEDAGGTTQP